ncbi:MAG TPA: hypothetical protein VLD37_04520 [Candidatus Bilamarchaeum sp.]|nr:hypothetical protein [Candidatus Bilamarchaeum sp.]
MAEFVLAALALGIKHSFDADHLLAVSNLLTKSRSLKRTLVLSANWTLGHMGGAILAAFALFMFRDSILAHILDSFESVVALMLIAFGILGLMQARFMHRHEHAHGGTKHAHAHFHLKEEPADHSHEHMLGIGIVQGLASNDELLLLLTVFLGLGDLAEMVLGTLVFSVGVLAGMVAFGIIFTLPALASRSESIGRAVNLVVGLLSIAYGLKIILGY